MKLIARMDPQPPRGIKYMVGGQSWLPVEQRDPIRLICEEWGNMGPLELRPEIPPNKHGMRVRFTEFLAPDGAIGFKEVDGVYYWTDTDMFGRTATGERDD